MKENKKPLDEIKKLIDNNINVDNYIPLSEIQKNNITDDIQKSSELRIKNYEMAFYYIKTSLDEIKFSLHNIVNPDEEYEENNVNVEKYFNKSLNKSSNSNSNSNVNSSESKSSNSDNSNSSENESDSKNSLFKENEENLSCDTEKDELNINESKEEKKNNDDREKEKEIINKTKNNNEKINNNIKKNNNDKMNVKQNDETDFLEEEILEGPLIMPLKSCQNVKDMSSIRSTNFSGIKNNESDSKSDNEKNNIRNKSINDYKENEINNTIGKINQEIKKYEISNDNENNDKENIFKPLTKSEIISKDNNCFIFWKMIEVFPNI